MAKKYSAKEVARHNNETDLWMILDGGVYDVTKFLSVHPGGEEVLLNLAGKDGTVCFDDIGHTTEAIQLRETLRIGELTVGETTAGDMTDHQEGESPDIPNDDSTEGMIEKDKQKPSALLPFFFGILAIIYAFMFYYLH